MSFEKHWPRQQVRCPEMLLPAPPDFLGYSYGMLTPVRCIWSWNHWCLQANLKMFLTIRYFRYTIPFQGFQWFTESISELFLSSWRLLSRKCSKVHYLHWCCIFWLISWWAHCDQPAHGDCCLRPREILHLDIQCAVCLHTTGGVLGNQAGMCSGPQQGPTRVQVNKHSLSHLREEHFRWRSSRALV